MHGEHCKAKYQSKQNKTKQQNTKNKQLKPTPSQAITATQNKSVFGRWPEFAGVGWGRSPEWVGLTGWLSKARSENPF